MGKVKTDNKCHKCALSDSPANNTQTVVGVVFSVIGTITNTSSVGNGSNPTIGIQSLIVTVNFYRTLSVQIAFIESGKTF
jgi:hypothetical protein